MGKYGSDQVALLIAGRDVSGNSTELAVKKSLVDPEETTGFGDSWEEREVVGVQQFSIEHSGIFDDALNDIIDQMIGSEGVELDFMVLLAGNVQGRRAVCCEKAVEGSSARNMARGELHKVAASYQGSGILDEATLLQSLSAEAGAGATSDGSLNNESGTTDGGRAYLQATALTLGGYDSVTVKIQESSDDGTDPWSDVITFANIAAIPFADLKTIVASTTVEQWLRVTLTWNGAGSGESVTLAVAFKRD